MALFFFDVRDNDRLIADESGDELADAHEARRSALEVLAGLVRERLQDGDCELLSVTVKTQDCEVVYIATLTLSGEWKVNPDRDR